MNMKEQEHLLERYSELCDSLQELEEVNSDLEEEVKGLNHKIAELEKNFRT